MTVLRPQDGNRFYHTSPNTYAAATAIFTPASSCTDAFIIGGSATKVIRILRLLFSGVCTTAQNISTVSVLMRSTANSGGTPVVATAVPLDSQSPAATALVQSYTANPTVGTVLADIWRPRIFIPAAATATYSTPLFDLDFTAMCNGQGPILRGLDQQLAINLNATVPSGFAELSASVIWTED